MFSDTLASKWDLVSLQDSVRDLGSDVQGVGGRRSHGLFRGSPIIKDRK